MRCGGSARARPRPGAPRPRSSRGCSSRRPSRPIGRLPSRRSSRPPSRAARTSCGEIWRPSASRPSVEASLGELFREYQFGEHLSRGQTANYQLAERLGLTEYLVERFSIAGTPEECCRKIDRLRAAGVANICFNLGTVNDLAGTLDLFGREVLPGFADGP